MKSMFFLALTAGYRNVASSFHDVDSVPSRRHVPSPHELIWDAQQVTPPSSLRRLRAKEDVERRLGPASSRLASSRVQAATRRPSSNLSRSSSSARQASLREGEMRTASTHHSGSHMATPVPRKGATIMRQRPDGSPIETAYIKTDSPERAVNEALERERVERQRVERQRGEERHEANRRANEAAQNRTPEETAKILAETREFNAVRAENHRRKAALKKASRLEQQGFDGRWKGEAIRDAEALKLLKHMDDEALMQAMSKPLSTYHNQPATESNVVIIMPPNHRRPAAKVLDHTELMIIRAEKHAAQAEQTARRNEKGVADWRKWAEAGLISEAEVASDIKELQAYADRYRRKETAHRLRGQDAKELQKRVKSIKEEQHLQDGMAWLQREAKPDHKRNQLR